MESNTVVQCQSKLQQLFQKFLEPDFEIKTDTYLNRLLTHLSSQEKTDDQIFTDWLLQAVTIWESQKVTPSAKIAFFTLNLASLVSRNEGRFCHLSGGNFYISLINVVKARQPETTPAVKLGYIKLMRAFLEHKSGIQWIVGNDLWIDILKLSLTNQTVYITREGYRFIAKLLEQTVDVDEEFCHRVVKEIMVPLGDSTYKTIKPSGDMMEISDETVYQNLSPTLQLIGDTLEYFLESVLFTQNDCRIVLIFLRDFHLEQQICNLMMIAQNKYLVFDLGKIMFIMQFLELYIGVISNNLKMGNVKTSVRKIMSIFRTNFSKGNYENVMKLCYYGQLYWNLMGYKIPCMKVNKDNEPISFANQLLVIQLLPIFAVAMKYCVGDSSMIDSDEFRDQYVQKFFMMMCENTVRIAYGWRDFLTSQTNLFEIATKGLIYIMKSRKYYPRERAAMTFQSFVYTLKDVMRVVKEAPEKIAFFSQQVGFFSLLFDAFVVFIEEFQITWRDSVETICVMSICFDFLSIPTWPTQLVVKALKLVNVSIVKYMSPNLALLVDRTTDSTMAVLGPLLYTKLHDMTWEVRDSAMEVVCTMSHLSNTKVESSTITFSIFTEWIQRAVATWNAARIIPPRNIATFCMNLVSLFAQKEERFCELNNNNFFIKLVNVLKARQPGAAPSIKLAYINLISAFLEHKSGIEWMVACTFWEDIYQLSLTDCETVVEKSTKFMSKLLEKTVENDELFCDNVVKRVMFPLGENVYKSTKASEIMEVADQVVSEYLKPTLTLMGNILEYFLEETLFDRGDFRVLLLFLKNFHQEERISDLMILAQSKNLVFHLGKIMYIMQFLELYLKAVTNTAPLASLNATIQRIKNNFTLNISKGCFKDVILFATFGQLYWNLIETKVPIIQIKKITDVPFTDGLVVIQVLAQFCLLLKYVWNKDQMEELWRDEFRDCFIHKLFKMLSCNEIIRLVYMWRDCLVIRNDLFEISIHSLLCIQKSRKYYSRNHAVVVVQTLIYNLKDISNGIKESPSKFELFHNHLTYLSLIFEVLAALIEEFQITWKDSLESIDLLPFCFDFLMLPYWPKDIIVLILKLVNIATAKYMAPNLALLLDSTSDSTIALMGPLLYAKLCDEVKEVKMAALEVICTMARMSGSKKTSTVLNIPLFTDWLTEAVTTWEADKITPHPTIAWFTLNLAALLSKNENKFNLLNNHNFFIKLVNIVRARQQDSPLRVKSAYITLLSTFLEHKPGIEWITASIFWEDIFKLSLSDQNEKINVKSCDFMAKILNKTIDYDENFCSNVIKRIMAPLSESIYKAATSQFLTPTLKLMGNILEQLLEEILHDRGDLRVAFLFLKHFHLEDRISDFIIIPKSEALVLHLAKIMFIMQYFELYFNVQEKKLSVEKIIAAVEKIKKNYLMNISKGSYDEMIEFLCFGSLYWNVIESKIFPKETTTLLNYSLHSFCMILMPISYIVCRSYVSLPELTERFENDECRSFYYNKFYKKLDPEIFRICYSWRDHLMSASEINHYCTKSLIFTRKARNYVTKYSAVFISHTIIYYFVDITRAIKESPEKLEVDLNDDFFPKLIELLVILIEDFHISWKDNFDDANLMATTFDFLMLTRWPTSVIVQALKLLNVAVRESMSPNMALLVDETANSTLDLLGPLISVKLLDVYPIRLAALEVTYTMAQMAGRSKYCYNLNIAEHALCVVLINLIRIAITRYISS